MIIKSLNVCEIALTKLDTKNSMVELQVNFANESPLRMNAYLDDNYDLFISKLIKTIKAAKHVDTDYDDDVSVLKGISVVTVANEEDIKEKAPKKLYMVNNRLDILKHTKTANEYIRLYSQLSTFREVIYSSGSS